MEPPQPLPEYDPYVESGGRDVFYLSGIRFRIPTEGSSGVFSEDELCWCLKELTWMLVVTWFQHRDGLSPEVSSRVQTSNSLCAGRTYPSIHVQHRVMYKLRSFGIGIVREALVIAKANNPELVWIGPPYPLDGSGGQINRSVVFEAQHILNYIGFQAGLPDGSYGPRTKQAIMMFQSAVGLPVNGEIDATTVALLRNSLYFPGFENVKFGQY
jgi:hypothetical protein